MRGILPTDGEFQSFPGSGSLFAILLPGSLFLILTGFGTTQAAYAAKKNRDVSLPRIGDTDNHKTKNPNSVDAQLADKVRIPNPKKLSDTDTTNPDLETQNWSSAGLTSTSPGSEITNGVRVEDIVEPPSEYHYASFGKPDPFVPPLMPEGLAKEANPGPTSLEIPIVSALQRYSVDQLSIVGIWQHSNGDRKALVLTPTGSVHGGQGVIVKAGDPIGDRGGKILAIGNDFIAVREFFLTQDGVRQFEDRRMLMAIKPPDSKPTHLLFKPGSRSASVVSDDRDGSESQPRDMPGSVGDANAVGEQLMGKFNMRPFGPNPSSVRLNAPMGLSPGQLNSPGIPGGYAPSLPQMNLPVGDAMNKGAYNNPMGASSPGGFNPLPAGNEPDILDGPGGAYPPSTEPNPLPAAGIPSLDNQPSLNGVPVRYVGGATGSLGSDITQPASSSVPIR